MGAPTEELRRWAASRWPEHDWGNAEVAHGAFHEVLVADTVVARIAPAGHRTATETAVLRTVGTLALTPETPVVLAGPVTAGGRSGVVLSRVAGASDPRMTWASVRPALELLLEEFRAVPRHGAARLPAPHTWCGADQWPVVVDRLADAHLNTDAGIAARRVVADVQAIEHDVPTSFVHGDLGLHNMLWRDGRLSALIDFDHACWGDPAIDLAPFVGTFGGASVGQLASPDLVRRARFHRASLPLQVAAAAELAGREALRDHALRNFTSRLELGTLHDPQGRHPDH